MTLARGKIVPLSGAAKKPQSFGIRAARLGRLSAAGLPVPRGMALDFDCVRGIAAGGAIPRINLRKMPLVSLRSSPGEASWGGPPAILNLGMNDALLGGLSKDIGALAAHELYRRAIIGFGLHVSGIDAEVFEACLADHLQGDTALDLAGCEALLADLKQVFQDEAGTEFPQSARAQLDAALATMARVWSAPSAQILRAARGAGTDAGLGLIIQEMVPDADGGGTGTCQPVNEKTGAASLTGRFWPSSHGKSRASAAITLAALEARRPGLSAELSKISDGATKALHDVVQLTFVLGARKLAILDAVPAKRTTRAAIQIAVDLVGRGIITREDALLRIEPGNLIETLHPQIDPKAPRDVFAVGLPASPGAATGAIVFSPDAALASAAQGTPCILVRQETSPEDIRGMHAAAAVLTIRGGMTSHAAVIARGLGLPCIVGAADLRLNQQARVLSSADGRRFGEGALITVDGTTGEILQGAPKMIPAANSPAFDALMGWADDVRGLAVRANADTPQDALLARRFGVDGIGLCRTEHMFFETGRVTVMREMILAEDAGARQLALDKLLPMQRADFEELFEIMAGLPVTIRLLDPPLHEFLPHGAEDLAALAVAMNLPFEQVQARAMDLAEVNPMLGKRGVRLGITMPEIYDMQARAVFEAVVAVWQRKGETVIPEIMIPLVSANREAELVKARVDKVADDVRAETGEALSYKIGVMVETPRGALRAGDLARSSAFLSFGTNDLTQMTYGLSRDDAGRFMRDYVNQGVFPEDPFHSLDLEGVGELILLAANRGRAENPDLVLGLCGEHGGDPASIRFCKLAGFDYVSCSPFRVPIARLAAAQAALLDKSRRK